MSRPSHAPDFTLEKSAPNVTIVRMDVASSKDWRQRFLVRSDVHRDSKKCRRDLEKSSCEQALSEGAGIIDVGDLFDAMQGPGDRRACKEALRDEHARADYFDALIEDAETFYAPYAHNIVSLTLGNHEEACIRHYGTNLTKRLANGLRRATGAPVHPNGYQGWVIFRVKVNGTKRASKTMYCYHGSGGGGQVTKDSIQLHRRQSYVDADIDASGHTHDLWAISDVRLSVNEAGREQHAKTWGLKCGTLKQTYANGDTKGLGFEQRQGHRPKPVGYCWLELSWDGSRDRLNVQATTEAFE